MMNKKQKVFWIIILLIYLLLMIWCFIEKEYMAIIKSICILIGSFIMGIIYGILSN